MKEVKSLFIILFELSLVIYNIIKLFNVAVITDQVINDSSSVTCQLLLLLLQLLLRFEKLVFRYLGL